LAQVPSIHFELKKELYDTKIKYSDEWYSSNSMNPDPTERLSFWTATVGFTFSQTAYMAVNPGSIQRFTALPNFSKAKM
jgi:hypothetical protein